MTTSALNQRAQLLLKLLIEQYIREGEPVPSKALVDVGGLSLSPATVRHIMADLETQGYLRSPHISAGRIPTAQGYQFFVNSLLTVRPLQPPVIAQFQALINHDAERQRLLQSSTELLASLTSMASIVSLPSQQQMILQQIDFLNLSDARLLVVLVFEGNEVQNRIISLEQAFSPAELVQMGNYLTATYAGKTLLQVRAGLVAALSEAKAQMDAMMTTTLTLAHTACAQISHADVVFSGQSNLLDFALECGLDRLKTLFDTFAQKQQLLTVLDKCLKSNGVEIFVGDLVSTDVFDQCSVVAAPYKHNGQAVGVIGVIGPSRMQYQDVIPMVDVTAKILSSALNINK